MKEDSQAGFRRTRLPESNFSIREVKALTYFAIPLLTPAAHGKIPARTAVNPGNGLSLVSPMEQDVADATPMQSNRKGDILIKW